MLCIQMKFEKQCKELHYFFLMCMGALHKCTTLHHVHAWLLQRLEEDIRASDLELKLETFVSHYVGAENSGSLEDHPVLTTE